MVYRRRELWLLLFLAVSLGVGLAVREFRTGFPELADQLERLDAEESPPGASDSAAKGIQPQRPVKLSETKVRADGRLDLNRASLAELQQLPGIGPTVAQRIVEARERRGRFAAPEDLMQVPGIGKKKFEAIRNLVTVRE